MRYRLFQPHSIEATVLLKLDESDVLGEIEARLLPYDWLLLSGRIKAHMRATL
ncbi:hypothetical protein [Nocardia nova]|uniref:hypothetical protein n=1 Tax=Nocardia nova TaxID=37330 RepID=UPI0027391B1F|nr:hypothetical protein [Nocardia nova]